MFIKCTKNAVINVRFMIYNTIYVGGLVLVNQDLIWRAYNTPPDPLVSSKH
jgi:hypothetical protein